MAVLHSALLIVFALSAQGARVMNLYQQLQSQARSQAQPEGDTQGTNPDFISVIDALEQAAKLHPTQIAMRAPFQNKDGKLVKKDAGYTFNVGAMPHKYVKYTWKQYYDLVMEAAAAFVAMGLEPMDVVHIRGPNSPEWFVSFLGCIAAGGLPMGVSRKADADTLVSKTIRSDPAFIIVAKASDLRVYSPLVDTLDHLKAVIMYNGNFVKEEVPGDLQVSRLLLRWEEFIAKGKGIGAGPFQATVKQRISEIDEDQALSAVHHMDPATGELEQTTISHGSFVKAAEVTSVSMRSLKGEQRLVSFSPLPQPGAQVLDIMVPLYLMQRKDIYFTTFFPARCYFTAACMLAQMADAKVTVDTKVQGMLRKLAGEHIAESM